MATKTGGCDWASLAQSLADGFQALLKEVGHLSEREKDLHARLGLASEEYSKLANAAFSGHDLPEDTSRIAQNMLERPVNDAESEDGSVQVRLPDQLDRIAVMRQAFQAFKSVKANTPEKEVRARCPVTGQEAKNMQLEEDFTTRGTSGNLGCPFARKAAQSNGVPTPPHDEGSGDPIMVAEHHRKQSMSSVDAASANGSLGKCPIRYLDQHSPEEVAQYFQEHKHEIPRSHEVCVRRYQKNSESIRELDSKYGNLVSMIQGLGIKHQQFLPGKAGDPDAPHGEGSTDAVEEWAEHVDRRSEQAGSVPSQHIEAREDESRTSHFQRPLREVRVGESPSRPWGISVPFSTERPESLPPAPVKERIFVSQDLPATAPPPMSVAGRSLEDPQPSTQDIDQASQNKDYVKEETGRQDGPVQMRQPIVFNGPVFFGYSAEEAAAMVKALDMNQTTS